MPFSYSRMTPCSGPRPSSRPSPSDDSARHALSAAATSASTPAFAVAVGHDDVAHDDVRRVALEPLDRLAARRRTHDLDLPAGQRALDNLADAQAVVDHQHLAHARFSSSIALATSSSSWSTPRSMV